MHIHTQLNTYYFIMWEDGENGMNSNFFLENPKLKFVLIIYYSIFKKCHKTFKHVCVFVCECACVSEWREFEILNKKNKK